VSTIKVDTYLTRGGVSEIAIDKLKGASSASSISVVGEGGTTTTNLQQGLLKVWGIDTQGSGDLDSFNVASSTDSGTGNYEKGFTNAFSSTNFCFTGTVAQSSASMISNDARATASSVGFLVILFNDTLVDANCAYQIAGDLA